MSFPSIKFKTTNTEPDEALQKLVEQKFSSLEKYVQDETAVQCEVEFLKETAHQSGNHYRVDANLSIKGKLYRAEATEENFEKAIDEVRHELEREIQKTEGKRETMFKKGGRAIKDMLRFGN